MLFSQKLSVLRWPKFETNQFWPKLVEITGIFFRPCRNRQPPRPKHIFPEKNSDSINVIIDKKVKQTKKMKNHKFLVLTLSVVHLIFAKAGKVTFHPTTVGQILHYYGFTGCLDRTCTHRPSYSLLLPKVTIQVLIHYSFKFVWQTPRMKL